jgi:hypothetical protein
MLPALRRWAADADVVVGMSLGGLTTIRLMAVARELVRRAVIEVCRAVNEALDRQPLGETFYLGSKPMTQPFLSTAASVPVQAQQPYRRQWPDSQGRGSRRSLVWKSGARPRNNWIDVGPPATPGGGPTSWWILDDHATGPPHPRPSVRPRRRPRARPSRSRRPAPGGPWHARPAWRPRSRHHR